MIQRNRSGSPLGLIVVVLSLVSFTARANAGNSVRVVGQNDESIDRVNIQDAIDQVDPQGRVLLDGVFQLDGEALRIDKPMRLAGVAIDNDGDGARNEDWADGVDNDGDGSIDEDGWDAQLVGLTSASGSPLPETDRTVVFNRAIFVRGLNHDLNGLRIENLRFSGHFRAITLEPDTGSSGGTVCENLFPTSGRLTNLRIESNRFDNNARAIELEGRTRQARITRNVISKSSNIAIIVEGEEMGCPRTAGGFGTFSIGTPKHTHVVENLISSSRLFSVFNINSDATKIARNTITGGFTGLLSQAGSQVQIIENELLDVVFVGIDLFESVDRGLVADNRVVGGFYGIWVEPDGSDYQIEGNEFADALFAEILLDFHSFNNSVIAGANDRVIDDGDNNTVTIE